METELSTKDEVMKLRLKATDLKHRLLEVQSCLQRLRRTEKKQKMKESTPPPLKERKEVRKETGLNNYNNNKGDFFVPPTLDEVQAYMDEIGEHRFTALRFWNYYEARNWVLGKTKMGFWKCVLDNWCHTENEKAKRHRGIKTQPSQQNVVTFNAYKPIDKTGTVSREEYERMVKEGKL